MSRPDNAHLEPFDNQQFTAKAKAQIEGWLTPGMALANAIKILEERDFSCGASKLSPSNTQTTITCTHSTPPPSNEHFISGLGQSINNLVIQISWVITLFSKDGIIVTDFRVHRDPDDTASLDLLNKPSP